MAPRADIIVFGTGSFAGRIICDIAATAAVPVRVVVAGRNVERLSWLKVAANARATVFSRPAEFTTHELDLAVPDTAESAIAAFSPSVVVQAASSQPASVIAGQSDAWSRLVEVDRSGEVQEKLLAAACAVLQVVVRFDLDGCGGGR